MSFDGDRRELYVPSKASLPDLEERMVKSENGRSMTARREPYSTSTTTVQQALYRTRLHRVLLRTLGAWCRLRNNRTLSLFDMGSVKREERDHRAQEEVIVCVCVGGDGPRGRP